MKTNLILSLINKMMACQFPLLNFSELTWLLYPWVNFDKKKARVSLAAPQTKTSDVDPTFDT